MGAPRPTGRAASGPPRERAVADACGRTQGPRRPVPPGLLPGAPARGGRRHIRHPERAAAGGVRVAEPPRLRRRRRRRGRRDLEEDARDVAAGVAGQAGEREVDRPRPAVDGAGRVADEGEVVHGDEVPRDRPGPGRLGEEVPRVPAVGATHR